MQKLMIITALVSVCLVQTVQSELYTSLQRHLSSSGPERTQDETFEDAKEWLERKETNGNLRELDGRSPSDMIAVIMDATKLKTENICNSVISNLVAEVIEFHDKLPAKKSLSNALFDIVKNKLEQCSSYYNQILDVIGTESIDKLMTILKNTICKKSTPIENYQCLKLAKKLDTKELAPLILNLIMSIVGPNAFEVEFKGLGKKVFLKRKADDYISSLFENPCRNKLEPYNRESARFVVKTLRWAEQILGHLPTGYEEEDLIRAEAYMNQCAQIRSLGNALGRDLGDVVVRDLLNKK